MNLSNITLTEAQISLLDKGLTFIPNSRKIPLTKIKECRDRYIRNLRLKDFFRNKENEKYDPTHFKNKFKARSSWTPHSQGLSIHASQPHLYH